MKKSLVDKIKGVGKKLVLGASLLALPYLGFSQIKKNPKEIDGFKYSSTLIEGKKYNIAGDTLHGTPNIIKEIEKSRKNPLGIEVYPLKWGDIITFQSTKGDLIKGLKSEVTYIPQKTGLYEVILKSEADSSVFGIPLATLSGDSNEETNPVGSSFKVLRNAPNVEFKKIETPHGDVFYYPFVSPESNQSVENGEMLNFLLIDTTGTSLEYGFDGRAILSNPEGKIYSLKLTKDSDREKVVGTSAEAIHYSVNRIASRDSLKGDLSNYFIEKDTTNKFIYEIPVGEDISSIDSAGILEEDVQRTRSETSSKNKILNPNYPEFYAERIKSMPSTTGEVFYDGEPVKKTKSRKGFKFPQTAVSVGLEADVMDFEDLSNNNSNITSALMFKVGKDSWIGPYGSFAIAKGNVIKDAHQEDTERESLGMGVDMTTINSVDTHKETTYPFAAGLTYKKELSNNFDLYLGAGVAKKETSKIRTGTETIVHEREGVLLEPPKELSESVKDNYNSFESSIEAGIQYNLGKNGKHASLNLGAKYFDGKPSVTGGFKINFNYSDK